MSGPSRWAWCRFGYWRLWQQCVLGFFFPQVFWENWQHLSTLLKKQELAELWNGRALYGCSHCHSDCFLSDGIRAQEFSVGCCCCVGPEAETPFTQIHEWAPQMQRSFCRTTERFLFGTVFYRSVVLCALTLGIAGDRDKFATQKTNSIKLRYPFL